MLKMNKILMGHQYVANFLDAPVRLGMIYKMDDRQFVPAMHFNDAFPDIDLSRWIEEGSSGDIKFTETRTVDFKFGGSADSPLGATEIGLKIKRSNSVAGVIKEGKVQSIRFEPIKEHLMRIWRDKGYDRFRTDYIFVYDIMTAASGTLIYTEERNNEIVLTHKLGQKVTKVLDLASGEFEYVSNSKRTLEIIRNTAHKPLFKAFRFRKSWEVEVLG